MFSSVRERRLWLAAAAVLAAIYATLGLARTLADELRNRGLIDDLFFGGFVLILAAIVVVGLRRRPGPAEVALVMAVAVVYGFVLLRMALPEERTHLIEYSVLALVVVEALRERTANGRGPPSPALGAMAIAGAAGIVDEAIQALIPSRVFDWRDIAFNLLAVALATGAIGVLQRLRRPA